MSDFSARRRPVRAGRFTAVGLAGVAATFAIASLATASASAATNYGTQKIRVGVQIQDGAFAPSGTTTANTEATITETGPNAPDPGVSTCNTDAGTTEPGSTATYCIFAVDQLYSAQPGDTVTVTQSTVNDSLVIDSSTKTFGPCTLTPADENGVCSAEQTALFNDPGIPPTTQDDVGTVKSGGTIVIDVTANDASSGAPSTIAIDTPAAHGTATPIPSSSAAGAHARAAAGVAATSIRYTSDTGFSGHDKFTYTMTDANGSSTASVFLTVVGESLTPPAAVDDTATTVSGRPVTINVQRNDDPNGGGALHLTSVGEPSHGTAKIDGTLIVYTPASGFSGVDHFTYSTANSSGKASARVTVTVTAPTISSLPNTGAPAVSIIAIALVLITGGSLLAEIGRRQRRGHRAQS
ncbi:MAG: hypothetical protein QOE01_2598 [Actinomycetota bacterium]|jgi:hypothetical protein|nr:hypothetical protein [Actinomycetota bacterium]